MEKEEAIQYFRDHREDLIDIVDEFGLRFPYEDRNALMEIYSSDKETANYWKTKLKSDPNNENFKNKYRRMKERVERMESTYHIFDPDFDEERESRWIPKQYGVDANKVFEFRKDIFQTQDIYEDLELTDTVRSDQGKIWNKYNGQDGMYRNFPICTSFSDVIEEYDYENPYFDKSTPVYSTKIYHYKTELIRSYCLDSNGGVAIIERRLHTKYDNKPDDYISSRFQIVTLGEDDGFHFLNSANIYEFFHGKQEKFIKDLNLVINEYNNFIKNENK